MADPDRVVLVEDDATVAAMYRLGLEHHGFEVTTVGSGAELFKSLDGNRPDLIVLDYFLPGQNGADVLQTIRSDNRVNAVPVLMLSSFPPTDEGAVDRVVRYGAIGWLEKAKTSPDALARKIGEALGRSSAGRDRVSTSRAGAERKDRRWPRVRSTGQPWLRVMYDHVEDE